jgi:hypothetical protein
MEYPDLTARDPMNPRAVLLLVNDLDRSQRAVAAAVANNSYPFHRVGSTSAAC